MWMQLLKHPEIGEDLESLLADVSPFSWHSSAVINNGGGHLNRSFWGCSRTNGSFQLRTCCSVDATLGSLKTSSTQHFNDTFWFWLGMVEVVNKEGDSKWLQQQTKIQSLKVKRNPWFGCLGTYLLREILHGIYFVPSSFLLSDQLE